MEQQEGKKKRSKALVRKGSIFKLNDWRIDIGTLSVALRSFVNRICLVNRHRSALERWCHLSYMCPGANKPVSLATSSYVTDDRTEEWWRRRFMAPSNRRQLGWARQIGFVSVFYNYPQQRDGLYSIL